MTTKMVVGSNPTSHTLHQRLWDLVTRSLFFLLILGEEPGGYLSAISGFLLCLSCEYAGSLGV